MCGRRQSAGMQLFEALQMFAVLVPYCAGLSVFAVGHVLDDNSTTHCDFLLVWLYTLDVGRPRQ